MEKDNKLQTASRVMLQLPGVSQNKDTDGGMALPPNGTFALWQMLMAIIKGEKQNLDSYAEMQKQFALSLGGSNGIFARLYDVGCEVGEHDAQSMRDQAWGEFGCAIVAGLQTGTMAGTYLRSTRPQLNEADEKLKDLSEMEETIKKAQGKFQLGETPNGLSTEEQHKLDEESPARYNGWADGSQSVDNFGAKDPKGGINEHEARLNKTAAQHLVQDEAQLKEVRKKINQRKESLQNEKNNADTNFNSKVQMYNMVGGGLQNTSRGLGGTYAADEAEEKAKANAGSTVVGQVQQGVSEQERKEQQAQEASQEVMNNQAVAIGQAAAAQYRG